MKRKLPVLLPGVLALLLFACWGGEQSNLASQTPAPEQPAVESTTSDPIRIGGGFALSGDESGLDLPAANGAKLAIKEINAVGGINGRMIDFVLRDSKYQTDATARVCEQFVDKDKVVAVIGFTDTDSILACGPIIQKAGLPFITPGATSPKIPSQIGDRIFLACFGDNVQASAGAEFAAQKFGRNAYLLWDKDEEYTRLLAGYFEERFTAADIGGKIVLKDEYEDKATDFSAQITRLKALPHQPDFYYISAMPYNIGTAVKQMRDAGINGPIVGGDGYDDPAWVAAAGAESNHVFFSTHVLNDATAGSDAYKKFFNSYKAEYGHDPENAFAALGYDSAYLMADAIKRAGSTEANAFIASIKATRGFPGITGSITYGDSNVPFKSVTMIELKDGKYTLARVMVPQQVAAP